MDAICKSNPPFERTRHDWADLLREIVGNPFLELTIDPHWRTANDRIASRLAESAYDNHAFDQLPILAAALEESGCNQAPLLEHLRSPGHHYLGCWALDLVLEKN